MTQAEASTDPLDEVLDKLAEFEFDPLGFVLWAFPWGQDGTPLADEPGPDEWQRAQLQRIGKRLRAGGDMGAVIKEAISAGHGVGKSGEVAWIVLWAIATHEDTRGVVTANSETQLKTKTWAELAKWYHLFVARELFVLTATAIYSADTKHSRTWRIDQIPWSAENSEAFAGMHNKGRRILVVFDEASAIDDIIWEVTEGALTDEKTQILWLAYGNPTRTTGQFHKVCTRRSAWVYNRVDSRSVRFTNKAQIEEWVREYGEDSDFVRVRVKGQFPRAGFSNFISPELVDGARRRTVPRAAWQTHQKILSVDPARFGDDWSVITLRQGLKVHWQQALSGFDGPELAGRIVEIVRQEGNIACIAYDANGNGADLDSALRRAPDLPLLIPVMWGIPAKDDKKYFNQRSEAWGKMRDWLAAGEIPDDDILADELTSLDYGYDGLFRIQLQSKKDCKKNGGKSPDRADSLALSFIPELIDRKVNIAKVRPVQRRKVIWSGRVASGPTVARLAAAPRQSQRRAGMRERTPESWRRAGAVKGDGASPAVKRRRAAPSSGFRRTVRRCPARGQAWPVYRSTRHPANGQPACPPPRPAAAPAA